MRKYPSLQTAVVVSLTLIVLLYQNCSPGFVAVGNLDLNSLASSGVIDSSGGAKLNPFQCDGSLGVESVRRLSRQEYENTLNNLLGRELYNEIAPSLGSLYSDSIHKNLGDFSHQIDDAQMLGYQMVADRIYAALSTNPSLISSLGITCATRVMTDACRDLVITTLGLKAYRRPLTTAEVAAFQSKVIPLGATTPESIGWLLYSLTLSPDFLLHLHLGASGDEIAQFDLTPYEVASRISYMVGDSPPDPLLFDAARSGRLRTVDELGPHVDRLFALPTAKSKIDRFFQYWLQPHQLQASGFASDFIAGLDVAAASSEFNREMNEFIDYVIFKKRGSFADLILSRDAFPRNDAAASVLGALKVGSSSPSQTAENRIGLLMRPPVLATDSNETHPIVRGVKFKTRFLCDHIGVPVGAILAGDVSFSSDAAKARYSTRYRTAQLTSTSSCLACHASINPLGFAFENIDNLGRLRHVEKSYSSSGAVLGSHAVDTSVQVVLDLDRGPAAVGDGVELIENLMNRNRLPGCFATQMHRFYRLRERAQGDGCVLNGVYDELMVNPNGSILEAFKKQVLNAASLKRRIQ